MSRMTTIWFIACFTLFSSLATASPHHFTPLPSLDKKRTTLQMRIVEYQGETNGKMVIDIMNEGRAEEEFIAKGIYFVPKEIRRQHHNDLRGRSLRKGEWRSQRDAIAIQPRQTVRMELDVFCIDSDGQAPPQRPMDRVGLKHGMLQKYLNKGITGCNVG